MTEIQTQHNFAKIYDRLNNQPHLQELISSHFRLTGEMSYSPILEESDFQERSALWRTRQAPYYNLINYAISTFADQLGWEIDEYPGSFANYILLNRL